jgi:hypothetical protein
MLMPVRREEPGEGFRPQPGLPLEGGADKFPYGAAGGLIGVIQQGKAVFNAAAFQEPQLGSCPASVTAFQNGEIGEDLHNYLFIRKTAILSAGFKGAFPFHINYYYGKKIAVLRLRLFR